MNPEAVSTPTCMILAADVGGTKAVLGLFEAEGDRPLLQRKKRLSTWKYANLADLVEAFLQEGDGSDDEHVDIACFGVATAVTDLQVEPQNLPWTVDARELESALELPRVILVNDLVAMARGIRILGESELQVLGAGEPDPRGNLAVVAAGTGFGAAVVVREGSTGRDPPDPERIVPTEAGHVDFAPRTGEEVELMRFARKRLERVSVERIVSGRGIALIYEFLRQEAATGTGSGDPRSSRASSTHGGFAPESPEVQAEIESSGEPQVAITRAALEGRSALCARTLDLFVAAYGAAVGNFALTTLATGGVYVGGGIAPTILPKLQDGTFMDAFRDKGRLSDLVARIPVHVVLDPDTALLGAAAHALRAPRSD